MMSDGKIDADAFPLYWPEAWPRTLPSRRRRTARFKVSFASARDRAVRDLKTGGASDVIISTNIPLRRDGLPRQDVIAPSDPGVAVYWIDHGAHRVIACDQWTTARDNMRACGLAIEALRSLKRSGATQVIDRVFGGFAALPASTASSAAPERPWRAVLDLDATEKFPTMILRSLVEQAYRLKARTAHPDAGGSNDAMIALNRARAQALDYCDGRDANGARP